MADIASAFQKMNDIELGANTPVTQATDTKIGANLNALYDIAKGLNAVEFNSSTTWLCPDNVFRVFLIGCGGGAGGVPNTVNVISRGGLGAPLSFRAVSVSPGATYTIAIGGGGGSNGGGGATTFAGPGNVLLATLPGGTGASGVELGGAGPFGGGNNNGQAAVANSGAGGGGGNGNNPAGGAGGSGKLFVTYALSRV